MLCCKEKGTFNERGVVLLLVILFAFILSTIGLALVYISGMEEIVSQEEVKNARALYNAEAGMERAVTRLKNIVPIFPEQKYPSNGSSPFDPFTGVANSYTAVTFEATPAYAQGKYVVMVIPQPSNTPGIRGDYVIVSSGIITTGFADKVKVVRRTWRVDTTNSVPQKVLTNSWVEEPIKRIMH